MAEESPVRVLVVEDNPVDVEIVGRALERYDLLEFDVSSVPSVSTCKVELERQEFDVVLLDYNLPEENGLSLLRAFHGSVGLPPVIMLTGHNDVIVARDCIVFGASDYLLKDSLSPDGLGDAIRDALIRAREAEEKDRRNLNLERLVFVDPLTGLYNRRYLDHALEKECVRARRYGNDLSCLMIDLDDFKSHNDTFGHLEGDALLKHVATLIKSSVRDTDVSARYGGDEFCVLLPETDHAGAMKLAERIAYGVATMQLIVNKQSITVTASVGVFTPEKYAQFCPEAMLAGADTALRHAKARGKNQVVDARDQLVVVVRGVVSDDSPGP